MQLLVFQSDGTHAAARSLEEFLAKQGHKVIVTDTVQHALAVAQFGKPHLALVPTTIDLLSDTLELMQKLSLLGVPTLIVNAHGAGYSAADDKALAQALSRFARRGSENGNGRHH